jgi:hypothetical protein
MPQIVNLPNFGGQLGAGLGQGIGEGLMYLAQNKINKAAEQQKLNQGYSFWKSLGVDDNIAMGLASAPEAIQKSFLDRLEGVDIGGQQQQAPMQFADLGQQLASSQPQNQPQEMIQGMRTPSTGQPTMQDILQGLASGQPIAQHQMMNQQQQQQASQVNPLLKNVLEQQAVKQAVEPTKDEGFSTLTKPVMQVEKAPKAAVAPRPASGLKLGVNPQERRHREMLDFKREAAEKKEIADKYKMSKDTRKEIVQKAAAARQDLKDLDRLEELQKEGKLDTPGYIEFLKRSGLDIPALMEPGSEEFQKVSATFMRNAATYLGGRVSNYELEQFMKTIPSLSQSPEGRKRVIANLKYMTRGALEYNNALKEVIAENGGVPPYDLDEQIDSKVEKKIDKLGEMFKKDLAKPVPAAQNKLVTALQASLGDVAGGLFKNAGKALKGAGMGAVGGAVSGAAGGPIGATGGAILGGLGGLTGLI